ncbi:MAG: hypothetical protein WC360_03975 [Opitutales bacterium]|jgi:hypothetical protein
MKLRHAIIAVTLLASTLFAALPINPVPVQTGQDTVWVTASGKKYHRQDCRYAKTATPTTRAEAEAKGLTPCKVCKP